MSRALMNHRPKASTYAPKWRTQSSNSEVNDERLYLEYMRIHVGQMSM
jgi:hypothetical protein